MKRFLATLVFAADLSILLVNSAAGAVIECVPGSAAASRGSRALVGEVYDVQHLPIPLDAVMFTDAGLSSRVAVQRLFAARTPTDTVEVTVRFVNCTDSRIVLGVRISFLDSHQAPTEAPSAWQQVHLPPRGMAVYSERSMASATVANFVIELRDGSRYQ